MATYKKKVSIKGDFVKKGVEIKDGDIITIDDEGRAVEGNYGTQHIFKIILSDGQTVKDFNLNQTSINNMIDAFGEDSKNWVGKEVKVWGILSNVQGKMIKVYYLSHSDAELDDEGNFVLTGKTDEIPTINEEDDVPPPTEDDF